MFFSRPFLGSTLLVFLISSARSIFHGAAGYELGMVQREVTPPRARVNLIADRGQFANRLMTIRENANRPLVALDLVVAIERDDRFRAGELMEAEFYKDCPCAVVETGEILNPLQFAVKQNRLSWIRTLLATKYFDINQKIERDQSSLLHLSVINGDLEVMELLIQAGVDIDAVNNAGETALALSTMFSDLEVFTFLVNQGANVDIHTAISACAYENPDALVKILEYPGLMINELGAEGQSVLHLAIRRKFSSANIKLILEYPGINVSLAETKTGWTALHLACKHQNLGLTEMLLAFKANPLSTDLNGNKPKAFIDHDSVQLDKIVIEAENTRKAVDAATMIITAANHPDGGEFQYMPLDILRTISATIIALSSADRVLPADLERRIRIREIRTERIVRVKRTLGEEQSQRMISKVAIDNVIIALDNLDLTLESFAWNQSVDTLRRKLEQAGDDFENGFYIPFFIIRSIDSLRDVSVQNLELDDFYNFDAPLDDEDFDFPLYGAGNIDLF